MSEPSPRPRRAGGAQAIPRPTALRSEPDVEWPRRAAPTAAEVGELVTRAKLDGLAIMPTFPDARPAAVLIALLDGPEGAEVLLTKRSSGLRNHKGEISFPGGRIDPGETPVETALREALEEVALRPGATHVCGQLGHLSTVVSRSYIIPVVGTLVERPELTAHEIEVDRILWVPLATLVEPRTYREEWWGTPPLDRRMFFFDLDDETIWGATAYMLHELLSLVYGPPAIRTAP